MAPKIANTFNPMLPCDTDTLVPILRRLQESAPAFGSPENLAQLEAAARQAKQFVALMALPTDTLPN